MTDPSVAERRRQAATFHFRDVFPAARFGTASDRYGGWIGQIYPEVYRARMAKRPKRLGGRTFEEQTVPIESVRDYFDHFRVLELDFTYYRPLRDADGKPTPNAFVLEQYAGHAPDDAAFLLKAPRTFFARTFRKERDGEVQYVGNPDFLNAAAYRDQFETPARSILGDRLAGVIFEQEYQRAASSPDPEANIAELDGFFRDLSGEVQSHLELRSPHLLVPPYFDWLESRGLGFVFSHWTWLPPLRQQWRMCRGRFSAANGHAVVRLLTPLRVPYEQAYARAYPFDQPVPDIADTREARDMVLDSTALAYQALEQGAVLHVIANNRAWGNAPHLAQAIALRILEEEEKRANRA